LTCINEKSLTPGSVLIADPKDDAI
jgi:hypothetical protein